MFNLVLKKNMNQIIIEIANMIIHKIQITVAVFSIQVTTKHFKWSTVVLKLSAQNKRSEGGVDILLDFVQSRRYALTLN